MTKTLFESRLLDLDTRQWYTTHKKVCILKMERNENILQNLVGDHIFKKSALQIFVITHLCLKWNGILLTKYIIRFSVTVTKFQKQANYEATCEFFLARDLRGLDSKTGQAPLG